MTKFAQNATQMNSAIKNVHIIRKRFPKKLEMVAHFETPCNKLKNVNSTLEILRPTLKNPK